MVLILLLLIDICSYIQCLIHFLVPSIKSPENCTVFETNNSLNCIQIECIISYIILQYSQNKVRNNKFTNVSNPTLSLCKTIYKYLSFYSSSVSTKQYIMSAIYFRKALCSILCTSLYNLQCKKIFKQQRLSETDWMTFQWQAMEVQDIGIGLRGQRRG